MNYKLLLFCIIPVFILISCNKKPDNTVNNADEISIIQESIENLQSIKQTDSLIFAANQKDEEFQLIYSDSLLAEFRKEMGFVFYARSEYYVAEEYFIKSEESYLKAEMPVEATQMYANTAVINELTGHYKEAVAIYVEVADYFKQHKDSVSWASALGNIGVVYEEMGMADKAIYYDKLSLNLNLVMSDTLQAANKYNNIGVAYAELKNNSDSAVYYYTKAYIIYQSNGQAFHTAQVANNIGAQHIMLHNYTLAYNYLEKAEYIFDSLNNLNGIAETERNFGELYLAQDYNSEAVNSFIWVMDVFKELDSKKSLMEVGFLLSNAYIKMGMYPEAISSLQYANTIKDTLLNADNTTIIADMESKYQLNDKNSTIEILQLEEAMSQKQIKNQMVFIVLLVLVFSLLVLTYYFSFQKNKLKEKELRLELQNYILRIDKLQSEVEEKDNEHNQIEEKISQFELSEREEEVLRFIAHGYKNSEIADKLFISQNTIKTHIKNIYVKLDVRNRVEALQRVNFV